MHPDQMFAMVQQRHRDDRESADRHRLAQAVATVKPAAAPRLAPVRHRRPATI